MAIDVAISFSVSRHKNHLASVKKFKMYRSVKHVLIHANVTQYAEQGCIKGL